MTFALRDMNSSTTQRLPPQCGIQPDATFFHQRRRVNPRSGIGTPARTRTWNLRTRKPLLYPIELRGLVLELYRRRAELLGEGAMRVRTSVPTPGRLRGLQTLCRRTDPRKRTDEQEGKGLGIFWFTLHENIRIDDPLRFFFEPIWYLPAATKPQPLFDRPQRQQLEEKAAPAANETIPPYSHDYDIDIPDGRPFGGGTLG